MWPWSKYMFSSSCCMDNHVEEIKEYVGHIIKEDVKIVGIMP
jgi:hypothetical protein